MGRKPTLTILAAILAAHIALAATFASFTPFRTAGALFGQKDPTTGRPQKAADIGAPDERQHVNYVARLFHGGGFPVFDPHDPNLNETLESHQPPAFYALAAGWATITHIDIPPAPPASEGREMAQSEGIKLRALNVLLGTITLGGVFLLTFWACGRPESALVATAFAALLPMNAALDSAVSNDPLLICLCTWTLALLAKSLRDGWSLRDSLLIGVLTGLAILTKTTGVALIPVILLAALLPKSTRPTLKESLAIALPVALMAVPWWLRNQRLYGDPFALKAFSEAFVHTAQASVFIDGFGAFGYWVNWVGSWTVRSFVGVFGYMDIWLTNTGGSGGANSIYQIVWILIIAGAVGWIMSLRKEEDPVTRRMTWVNSAFFLLILALFLKFNAQYFQAQARYLYPALGPIACAMGIGLTKIRPDRWKAALFSTILVLAIANGFAIAKVPDQFAKRIEAGKSIP